MALRPAWKGYLKLSLVTCAVELFNATTQSEKVTFNILNRKTGNPVNRRYLDSVTGKPVADGDEVKGYEVGDEEFLLIEDDEIDSVQIESSHTLDLDGFVAKADIDPIYLDTPYYLAPSDKVSREAFAVIREALARKKMAGLARIVLFRRERPAVIEPFGTGLLLTTLRYGSTVREPDEIFDGIGKSEPDPDLIELATGIVDKRMGAFDPAEFEDRYETAVRDLVRSRKAGRKVKTKPASKPSNVVNLFDALKKSLGSETSIKAAPKTADAKRGSKSRPAPRSARGTEKTAPSKRPPKSA